MEGTPSESLLSTRITAKANPRSYQPAIPNMKLSVETIVVGAIAVAFTALSTAVITQEQGAPGSGGSPRNVPEFSQMTAGGFNTASPGTAEEEVLRFY